MMQSINALSLAPDMNDWLANSRHPRILHIFDRVCNLINESRAVLSIVTQQIGNGPFNLVIEDDILFSDHLSAKSPISIRANQLNLGDLTIHIETAKPWSPRPDWGMLHSNRENILNQLLSLRFFGLNLDSSLAKNARDFSTTPLNLKLPLANYRLLHNTPVFQSLISNLSSALANVDISSTLAITSQLAGLGNGLTPAGDDFILGAVLAAWIIHPPAVAKVLVKEITNTAAPLTTSLSAAWLRSAGEGEAGILWHDLFDALNSADCACIQASLDKIFAVGETSGADALLGFIGTLMSWARLVGHP